MNNNIRIAIVVVLILSMLLVVDMARNEGSVHDESPEKIVPNITNVPTSNPIIQEIIPQVDLSNIIICQKPDKDMFYGGIGGSENDPPNGTSIDQNLSEYYNMPTATGICGTYWYIVGWWFNQTEISKLPYETMMYGTSPYALGGGGGHDIQTPIAPIPEVPNMLLVTLGIFMVMILKKYQK